jgi:hypothetical protein
LWEQNLQSVPYVLLSSELANPLNGETGRLEITPPAGATSPDAPSAVTLDVSAIRNPGEYTGTLTILFPDTRQQETLAITARLRDALLWPFLVIAVGAGIAGWLLRVGTRARESVNFQKVVLRMVQGRLRSLPLKPDDLARRQAERELLEAELALRMGDVAGAVAMLDKVSADVQRLEQASLQLHQAQQVVADRQAKLVAAVSEAEAREIIRPAGAASPMEVMLAFDGQMENLPRLLNRARSSLADGQLAEMEKTLDQVTAALALSDTPPTTLPEGMEEGLEKAALGGWASWAIRWQVEPPAAASEPALNLQTGQRVTFWVSGAPPEETFTWQVRWLRPLKDLVLAQSETPVARFSFTPVAGPQDDYPRRCRVTALSAAELELGLDFDISQPFAAQVRPGRLVNIGEGLWLELEPEPAGQDAPPVWYVIPPRARRPQRLARLPYFPTVVGEHRFVAQRAGQWLAAAVVQVRPNLLDQELQRYRVSAWLAALAWAAVAGISGLVYISAQLNTFGSGLDYLLAFAWGLGVGAAAAPKEGLKETIQRAVGISPAPPVPPAPPVETLPPAAGSEEQVIPSLVKQSWASAKAVATSLGLTLVADVADPQDHEVVWKQEPEPGVAKGISQVKVYLDR